jgi:hypothetical protein
MLVDAENGESELHRRVQRLNLPGAAADSMEIFEAIGFDLADVDHRRHLDHVIDGSKPQLVIFDAFRSLWQGDEDRSRDVAPVVDGLGAAARKHDLAALLLHHATKSGASYRHASPEASLGFAARCWPSQSGAVSRGSTAVPATASPAPGTGLEAGTCLGSRGSPCPEWRQDAVDPRWHMIGGPLAPGGNDVDPVARYLELSGCGSRLRGVRGAVW